MDMSFSDLILYRIDPSRNMRRYYALTIQPNLFGGHSLLRNWGRVGSKGQLKVELFEDVQTAQNELKRLFKAKIKRGYRHKLSC